MLMTLSPLCFISLFLLAAVGFVFICELSWLPRRCDRGSICSKRVLAMSQNDPQLAHAFEQANSMVLNGIEMLNAQRWLIQIRLFDNRRYYMLVTEKVHDALYEGADVDVEYSVTRIFASVIIRGVSIRH